MNKRPRILISNDDGITAGGIRALVNAVKDYTEVTVVAPQHPQSAKGHGITIEHPLRMREVDIFGPDVKAFECDGTPADCVKMAKAIIYKDENPDVVLSGINHGSNAAINIVYSGTVSAAMEGALEGIDSIAFSLLNWSADADFSACIPAVNQLVKNVLEIRLPSKVMLNVNFPDVSAEEMKGFKVCRQADSKWVEEFDVRKDPHGNEYYWLTGEFINQDEGEDTDNYFLKQNYITVVPVQADLTAHASLSKVEKIIADV